MPLHILNNNIKFPPVEDALPDGLLAIGGDLGVDRLISAYKSGIFPWFDGDVPMWWCPNPRFVLFPTELKVSKSMNTLLKKEAFQFSINQAFPQVIRSCKMAARAGQQGTWITADVERAYIRLHEMGIAYSAEAWQDGKLAGGLYGIRMKHVFFGESMFSDISNASKYAFIKYVKRLGEEGVNLIDCQVYTSHLESLGARMIERKEFLNIIQEL